MKTISNILLLIAVIIFTSSSSQQDYWSTFRISTLSILFIIICICINNYRKIFPVGVTGKCNNYELKKTASSIVGVLIFSALLFYIWSFYYKKSYGNLACIFLGFNACYIVWTLISIIKVVFKKYSKILLYKNIFGLLILILIFKMAVTSVQKQILSGDTHPDLPFFYNFALVYWPEILKQFKSLLLFKRLKTESKAIFIEKASVAIFYIAAFIPMLTISNYPENIILFFIFISAAIAYQNILLKYLRLYFIEIAKFFEKSKPSNYKHLPS
ncbi:MAG: hypothetical protein J0L55_11760 [Caulobacterales bacterium]|nr:hypothetical protein [Caulobacterales bacterium]MCA0372837.1 hypothetical protein [Pseudomonadota bacterium]